VSAGRSACALGRVGLAFAVLLSSPALAVAESVCYGTTANGRLENGVPLPAAGANFVSYGSIPETAGRTYVHSKVRDVIVDAYRRLEREQPGKVFKYAETGFREGGQFKPHKTHRNGLSVDFIVPVTNGAARSVHLPTHPFNKYGYGIEFDGAGRYDGYTIDYEALAAHIVALDKAARARGVGIWRVIFDPQLAPNLYRTPHGDYLRANIQIPGKASWVRHDEHYHVDFNVPCRTLVSGRPASAGK
jgi:penicillin-insensitive murein DD-endopeptidase